MIALLVLSLAVAAYLNPHSSSSHDSEFASAFSSDVATEQDASHELRSRIEQIISQEGRGISSAQKREIAETIMRVSEEQNIDPLLILSIIKVESSFRPRVVSYAGAIGLMQVKPVVVRELGEEVPQCTSMRKWLKEPIANIDVGVQYLSYLRERFGQDNWYHVLAAYNMGPTRIKRLIRCRRSPSRRYYSKVMKVYRNYQGLSSVEAI